MMQVEETTHDIDIKSEVTQKTRQQKEENNETVCRMLIPPLNVPATLCWQQLLMQP